MTRSVSDDLKLLVASTMIEIEILLSLVTALLSVYDLRFVDCSLSINKAQTLLEQVQKIPSQEKQEQCSIAHRNAFSFVLREVKLCARLAFPTDSVQIRLPTAYCHDLL